MGNPFEIIDARLSNIETLLLDIKHKHSRSQSPTLTDPSIEIGAIDLAERVTGLARQTIYGLVSKYNVPRN